MTLRRPYSLLLALCVGALCLLAAACSSDEVEPTTGNRVRVHLAIGVARTAGSTAVVRRAAAYDDANADEGEMMRNWVVLIVSEDGIVQQILQSSGYSGEREEDAYDTSLSAGTYTFYTFANLSLSDVGLGSLAVGGTLPDGFDASTYSLSANKLAVADFSAGLPMSNKQTVTLQRNTTGAVRTVQLYVVRMPVKLQLRVTNSYSEAITLRSATLSDVSADGVVLPLLPTDSASGATGLSADERACRAELTATDHDTLTLSLLAAPQEIAAEGSATITAYLNPSIARNTEFDGRFMLTLVTEQAGQTATRHVVLDWLSMARNDLRIIPITLSDYRLMLRPQQYTAIGVQPPTVTDVTDLLTINFHWYGEFHLTPYIEQVSTGTEYEGPVTYSYDKTQTLGGDVAIFRTYAGTSTPMFYWDDHRSDGTPRIEGELADYTGAATAVMEAQVQTPQGVTLNLRRRFRIKMNAVDWSSMSLRLRALRSRR